MVEKALVDKLIEEMKRVRDEVMPPEILAEHRGSKLAGAKLSICRDVLDRGIDALARQHSTDCLDVFGDLKGIG